MFIHPLETISPVLGNAWHKLVQVEIALLKNADRQQLVGDGVAGRPGPKMADVEVQQKCHGADQQRFKERRKTFDEPG